MIRVFVGVSNKHNWTLRPFAYCFNTFWSELQPVVVAGYSKPDFDLPPNFTFHSIDEQDYPADRWTDGILKFLKAMSDEHFVWGYSDFWLRRTVNHAAVQSLHEYAIAHPDVFRIDLTNDRLFTHDPRYIPDYDKYGCLNLIKSNPDWPYHHSTQMGIFRRDMFMQLLTPNWSPWQFELTGGEILAQHPEWLVLGTRVLPVDYAHVIVSGSNQLQLDGIPQEHIDEMHRRGWLP